MTTITTQHNWPVYGHDWAVTHLRKSMVHNRIRHAYLFTGPDGIGKRTLAHALAMAMNASLEDGNIDMDARTVRLMLSGNHPDIVYSALDERTGSLKIEAIREVTAKLALKPYEARYRVAIMTDFERARPQAQDALLKTLEEPAETSLLLLTATNTDGILSTITSRCQVMNLRPVPLEEAHIALERHYGAAPPDADLLARVSGGRLGWAIDALGAESDLMDRRDAALNMLEEIMLKPRVGRFDIAQGLSKDKLALPILLELWTTYWRDVLLIKTDPDLPLTNIDREQAIQELANHVEIDAVQTALLATRKTIGLLTQTNANTRLTLEVMLLDYPGLRR